ncbi:hypothetical protein [Aureimonas ureilytica]|uniref:hypothetical protein n=1 Tax=Aureimonas ureilytica TaxID=401562 RepID=UPI000B274040|nr:hypothetical protein [Aureimonas ureilytica]
MKSSTDIHAAANKHFKRDATSSVSTFEAVRSAARSTRDKAALLRQSRMDREDQAAAIQLPNLTKRSEQ